MALQIRRGIESDRASVTPVTGELLYTTDQNKLYVGDGSTPGGNLISGSSSGLTDVVNDASPQLGGDLDINNYSITGTGGIDITGTIASTTLNTGTLVSNSLSGNMIIQSSGVSGDIIIASISAVSGNNEGGDILITCGSGFGTGTGGDVTIVGGVAPTGRGGDVTLTGGSTGGNATGGNVTIRGGASDLLTNGIVSIGTQTTSIIQLGEAGTQIHAHGELQVYSSLKFFDTDESNYVSLRAATTVAANVTWILPTTDGGAGYVLATDGLGELSWVAPSGVTVSIIADTNPKLGGNLSVNGHSIVSESDGNITIVPNGTGMIQLTPNLGGKVVLDKINWPTTVGAAGQVLTTVTGGADATWQYIVSSAAPTNAGDAGAPGQIAFDASHVYICVALNTWVRASLATWP